jgi:hypothetical protein
MKEKDIQEVINAKRQIVEGSLTIWNVRLGALAAAGNLDGVLDQMTHPAEEGGGNKGCNGNCGCPEGPPLNPVTQPARTRR